MLRFALTIVAFIASGSSALAAVGPFVSLGNTNFIVLLAFLLFVGVLFYFGVPGLLAGLLDKRADGIKSELDEAKAIHEEAKELYASFERKTREVKGHANRIVEHARHEAQLAAEQAKVDLEESIARRIAAAEDQIVSAQNSAVKEVRDTAIAVAIAAAGDAIAGSMKDADQQKLLDEAIASVGARLH